MDSNEIRYRLYQAALERCKELGLGTRAFTNEEVARGNVTVVLDIIERAGLTMVDASNEGDNS